MEAPEVVGSREVGEDRRGLRVGGFRQNAGRRDVNPPLRLHPVTNQIGEPRSDVVEAAVPLHGASSGGGALDASVGVRVGREILYARRLQIVDDSVSAGVGQLRRTVARSARHRSYEAEIGLGSVRPDDPETDRAPSVGDVRPGLEPFDPDALLGWAVGDQEVVTSNEGEKIVMVGLRSDGSPDPVAITDASEMVLGSSLRVPTPSVLQAHHLRHMRRTLAEGSQLHSLLDAPLKRPASCSRVEGRLSVGITRMPLDSLIEPSGASDAGGVAGRRGQKYQDHVAAGFVVAMLSDPSILQIECETADDVTIRRAGDAGITDNEYVQVKTTENEDKWTVQALLARDEGRVGTSIAERSLACDAHPGEPSFRLVTNREPRANLAAFKKARSTRSTSDAALVAASTSIAKRYPSFTSPAGRTLTDWCERLLWEVEPSIERLAERNVLELHRLANRHGERPTTSEIEAAYSMLLNMVIDAGDASRVLAPDRKRIPRVEAVRWWRGRIEAFAIERRKVVKVYRVATDEFFSRFLSRTEEAIKRTLSAFDVEFDGGRWRSRELVEHLINWVPEVVLPPEILATFDHHTARKLLARAVRACEARGALPSDELLAELILHAILRHHHGSEPIACKIFHMSGGTLTFGSAHIVLDDDGDQLWLGQARLTVAADLASLPAAVATSLRSGLDRDVLKEEREIVLQLRHPAHLSEHDLGRSMAAHGRIDDLLAVLHVPLLVAYDSAILAGGFSDNYLEGLRAEAESIYADLKNGLQTDFRDIRIHIFLIPVECADTLARTFGSALGARR